MTVKEDAMLPPRFRAMEAQELKTVILTEDEIIKLIPFGKQVRKQFGFAWTKEGYLCAPYRHLVDELDKQSKPLFDIDVKISNVKDYAKAKIRAAYSEAFTSKGTLRQRKGKQVLDSMKARRATARKPFSSIDLHQTEIYCSGGLWGPSDSPFSVGLSEWTVICYLEFSLQILRSAMRLLQKGGQQKQEYWISLLISPESRS
ncbi:uncharacterized protein N7482_008810 [Penicillium canariense]|uniref:Uncharacterized protein n=1 Tax=Penicillium canariense TaxID=189055 RepID=A0A9W9HWZ5_9EURO|nr:uncharacterized protein N7482_008810 [Penicillium canariense]KAJ5157710.1 hypothetical protein N7482_008810 [Penicillium canariense]